MYVQSSAPVDVLMSGAKRVRQVSTYRAPCALSVFVPSCVSVTLWQVVMWVIFHTILRWSERCLCSPAAGSKETATTRTGRRPQTRNPCHPNTLPKSPPPPTLRPTDTNAAVDTVETADGGDQIEAIGTTPTLEGTKASVTPPLPPAMKPLKPRRNP